MKTLALWLLSMLMLVALACSDYTPPIPEAGGGPDLGARGDCQQIFGTPFRSPEEKQWFNESCLKWPATDFTQIMASAARPESPECAAIRGRLYRNTAERQWFLANCLGGNSGAIGGAAVSTDRSDCNAIRGTPYRSTAERVWYIQNCLATPSIGGASAPGQPAPSAGRDSQGNERPRGSSSGGQRD